MIVGVTQRVDPVDGRAEVRDTLDQQMIAWLSQAGFVPVPIPNTLNATELAAWLHAVAPQALVLTGGSDFGVSPARDQTENVLLDWAEKLRMPVLGICRGLQLMAVRAGIKLVQREGHVRTVHVPKVERGSTQDWPARVNSFHNWTFADRPSGYQVAVRAEDSTIEAVVHESLPWEGWMWHPEREASFSAQDTLRVQKLFGSK